jgi:hypothetical protein
MNAAFPVSRIVFAWIVLEAIRAIVSVVIPIDVGSPPGTTFAWLAATDLIVVAAIGIAAMRSDWRGLRLGAALAAIPFTVAFVNVIEGFYFLQGTRFDATRVMLHFVLTFAVSAPVWGRIFSKDRAQPAPNFRPWGSRGVASCVGRLAASDVAYLVVYLAGGFTIISFVRDYYATRTLPPPEVIFGLQLLVRGPLFILVCILLVRMMGMARGRGAFAIGAIFALVSGVAPLMMPSPYLPDAIRWVHFWEVSVTNFIFAVLVAAMWGPPKAAPAAQPVKP